MPSYMQIAAASALLALGVSAVPFEKRAQPFSIKQEANVNYVKNAHLDVAKTLAKYGGSQDAIDAALAAASAAKGSVVASPQEADSEWLCPVTVGDQTFMLDFDTGSSDLWVFGAKAKSGSSKHTYYAPTSSAKLVSGASWSISYGDGSSASGTVYKETVTIGGTSVVGQEVEAANTASSEFLTGANDGLVGLAFDSINTVKPTAAKTFMTNAQAAGLAGVFTANLNAGAPGTYNFGYIDDSEYSSSITYTDIDNSQGFWSFTPESGDAGIADTGTTLIYISDASCEKYYKQIKGAKKGSDSMWGFPCTATAPDFSITVEGYKATVPGSYINFQANGDGTCFGGIQSSDSIGIAIYGDVFLKSQFVVFDLGTTGQPRLGLAPKATSSKSNMTSTN